MRWIDLLSCINISTSSCLDTLRRNNTNHRNKENWHQDTKNWTTPARVHTGSGRGVVWVNNFCRYSTFQTDSTSSNDKTIINQTVWNFGIVILTIWRLDQIQTQHRFKIWKRWSVIVLFLCLTPVFHFQLTTWGGPKVLQSMQTLEFTTSILRAFTATSPNRFNRSGHYLGISAGICWLLQVLMRWVTYASLLWHDTVSISTSLLFFWCCYDIGMTILL